MDKKRYPLLKTDRKNLIKFFFLLLILAVMTYLTIRFLPFIISLRDAEAREAFSNQVNAWGFRGWLVILGIQVTQVVLALIPGEPIEIISGVLFGTIGGTLTCLLGILIGSLIIYYLVQWLGMGFVHTFLDEKKTSRFQFLMDEKRLRLTVFLLFFIPGTPKDLLTYFVPATRLRAIDFFWIATLARIPSVMSSCYLGEKLMDGNWLVSVLVFIITGCVGIAGILLERRVVAWREARKTSSSPLDNMK